MFQTNDLAFIYLLPVLENEIQLEASLGRQPLKKHHEGRLPTYNHLMLFN